MDKTEDGVIIKCLQKKDMTPEDTLNCHRTHLIHRIQPRLTFICSLNSNHTFLVTSLETNPVVEVLGGGGGDGIAICENCLAKRIDGKWNYINPIPNHPNPSKLRVFYYRHVKTRACLGKG